MEYGGKSMGRIIMGLYGYLLPQTVNNFVAFAGGYYNLETSYANSTIHKIISNSMIQGGKLSKYEGLDEQDNFMIDPITEERAAIGQVGPGYLMRI
jgi:cyclophilin family peptidyl-prolyl cis-trans isomerase